MTKQMQIVLILVQIQFKKETTASKYMMNLRAVLIKKKTDCLALNNIWHTADRQWEKRKKEERDRKKERLLQEKTYSISVYTIMKSANIFTVILLAN